MYTSRYNITSFPIPRWPHITNASDCSSSYVAGWGSQISSVWGESMCRGVQVYLFVRQVLSHIVANSLSIVQFVNLLKPLLFLLLLLLLLWLVWSCTVRFWQKVYASKLVIGTTFSICMEGGGNSTAGRIGQWNRLVCAEHSLSCWYLGVLL